MQITIDLPPALEQDLIRQAAKFNVPLQTLILQALRRTIQTPPMATFQWSEVIFPMKEFLTSLLSSPTAMNSFRLMNRNYSDAISTRYLRHQRLHQGRSGY
jgi:hypothetical protein